MHRGGPYWLLPRRAPFGRRAGQPSKGAPTDTARSAAASQRSRPHSPLLGEERTTARPQQEPEHRVLRSFPPSGTYRDGSELGTKLRSVAAKACRTVFGQTGTPRRVVRLSTADSLCDRMERGEEEASTGRRIAYRRSHFRRCQARRLPTSGRREFPSGNSRSARDLEVAKRVSRGQAPRRPHPSPFARKTAPHRASASATPQTRPRLLQRNEECPHFNCS